MRYFQGRAFWRGNKAKGRASCLALPGRSIVRDPGSAIFDVAVAIGHDLLILRLLCDPPPIICEELPGRSQFIGDWAGTIYLVRTAALVLICLTTICIASPCLPRGGIEDSDCTEYSSFFVLTSYSCFPRRSGIYGDVART